MGILARWLWGECLGRRDISGDELLVDPRGRERPARPRPLPSFFLQAELIVPFCRSASVGVLTGVNNFPGRVE
jgi:hypothetical protein